MPLVDACLRIKHYYPVVRIAVSREHLLRCNIDRYVGRSAEPLRGIAIVTITLPADLQDKPAIHGELEELAILLAVPGEPDKVSVINEDPMLAFRPLKTRPGTAPIPDKIARLIKDQDWRSGDTAFGLGRVLLGSPLPHGQ